MCFTFQKVSKAGTDTGTWQQTTSCEWGGRWGRGGALFAPQSCLVHGDLHWLGPGQGDLELTCGRFKPASVKFPSFGMTAVTEYQIENCLLKKKIYEFRVRCALFKDLTCSRPSLLHTVTILLDINGGTFNFIRTQFFGVFLQHAYNMFLISRSRLKSPRMLRMFPR